MADPFEQFTETDKAIEEAKNTIEAQQAAEEAARQAQLAAEEAARQEMLAKQEAARQEMLARQQSLQAQQPAQTAQQQNDQQQYNQQQYSQQQYGETQNQYTQAQQHYNQYGQTQNMQGASIMDEDELPREYKPVSMWGYVGYEVLFSLPLVGLILMFIFSFSGTDNVNLKNFARGKLIMVAIGVAMFVLLIIAAAAYGFLEEIFG